MLLTVQFVNEILEFDFQIGQYFAVMLAAPFLNTPVLCLYKHVCSASRKLQYDINFGHFLLFKVFRLRIPDNRTVYHLLSVKRISE